MERIIQDAGLIVAGGGQSRRFGTSLNKLLCELDGLTLFCHSLLRFLSCIPPEHTVIVVPTGEKEAFEKVLKEQKLPSGITVCEGGKVRAESVVKGLESLPDDVDKVAVQDAARPFSSCELLNQCIDSARKRGNGVAAHVATETMKVFDTRGKVVSTPDRSRLAVAQTPQVFTRQMLAQAYDFVSAENVAVTDDAQAVEYYGQEVYLVFHEEENPKITYPRDLERWQHCFQSDR